MPSAGQQQAVMIQIQRAVPFVARRHRHQPPPDGAHLAAGIMRGTRLMGVAILGRPVPPAHDDRPAVEGTRTGIDNAANTAVEAALYRAAWSVARMYGYQRLITHTHLGEIT